MSIVNQFSSRRRRTGGTGFIVKLCYTIDILLSMDLPPFRLILVLVALCLFLLPAPACRYFSSTPTADHNSGHSSAVMGFVNGGWLLPATPLTLIFLLQWFYTASNWTACMPRRTLVPYWIASEGISPWVVTVMVVQLVLMVRYRPSFQDHSLLKL